jgi:hypothetical protein
MDKSADRREREQRLNAIYAWSRLLQLVGFDEAARSRALQTIETNAERLLLGISGKAPAG